MIQSSLYRYFREKQGVCELVLAKDLKQAQEARDVLRFIGGLEVFMLPELRVRFGDDLSSFREEFLGVLSALRGFYDCTSPKILVAPFCSILYSLPKSEILQSFCVQHSQQICFDELKCKILDGGYECVDVVELEGEVSFRGDIIDIFMPDCERPYRIAFFDNEIESIREFDVQTQMSIPKEIGNLKIVPALFSLSVEESLALEDKIQKSDFEGFAKDIASFGFWLLDERSEFLSRTLKTLISPDALIEAKEIYELDSMQNALSLSELLSYEKLEVNEAYRDIVFNPANLASMLQVHTHRAITILAHNEVVLKNFELEESSFTFRQSPVVVNIITPSELILSLNVVTQKRKIKKATLKLNEISQGEYVVHTEYGVGIFKGIEQVQVAGVVRDFIEISYWGNDKLLLPVENLNMIDRYVADSGQIPMLDRLGKGSFAKLKQRVRAKLLEIANGIIETAAKRNLLQGVKIDTHSPELVLFQNSSGFKLTQDQVRSINEIYTDLESGKVMDRLLCGDVGFGKTEVAINAMYAVYLSGFQSALIVPTTLLASQHFHSLQDRLERHGVRIARCDRFLSFADKKSLLSALKEGKIDMVVGTHALLGVEFQNLGLIVIDEEHKFGVKQKEKIKELCANTHLLSMSATPIPRTLNMALSQIKSMSSLQTPPVDRIPVRTFVKVGKSALIKEVILRELRRGGQVFYIHNNIASIGRKKDEIAKLLPQLKIAILHSQVDNKQSEKIMLDFLNNAYNLLLCTSIMESGIHFPNANTIIVEGADRFGMADLHQLRGRVGRSNKEGFCYFFVEDLETITPEAKKRLSALEKNSFLGSGENLAYYDLEIRGGGNLLGEAQSGHIKSIGYSLYLRMLEECIHHLSGKGDIEKSQCDIKLNLNAYLNPELIPSDKLRLELYRRLSLCQSINEVTDIESEIHDRFGRLDSESEAFLELIRIKVLANALELKQIMHYGQNITITHADESKQTFQSPSKDWDDVVGSIMRFLRQSAKKQNLILETSE